MDFHPEAHIVVKIDSIEERKMFRDTEVENFIDSNVEVGKLLVERFVKGGES